MKYNQAAIDTVKGMIEDPKNWRYDFIVSMMRDHKLDQAADIVEQYFKVTRGMSDDT